MLSDLVLSVFSFAFYYKLRKLNTDWSLFFCFMSLSAFAGAIYHGYNDIGEWLRFFSWSALAVAIIYAQKAFYKDVVNKVFNYIFIFNAIVLLGISIYTSNFIYMVINMIVGLFGFVVIGGLFYLKDNSNKITYGILISFTSVFFVIGKINFNEEYLTFNDIGHYISILSLYIMTIGVKEDFSREMVKS